MASDPKSTLAVKQVAQPPRNKTATSTSASKRVNSGDVARQDKNKMASKAFQGLVTNETRGVADTSHPISSKIDAGVEENAATKPRGLQVPTTTTATFLDLLRLFNQNETDQKPTVFRSPSKVTDVGLPEQNGKNMPKKKVDNKTPAKHGDKKLPLR